jgi:hypothetical protein
MVSCFVHARFRARSRDLIQFGTAIASRMLRIVTEIMISMRVKPLRFGEDAIMTNNLSSPEPGRTGSGDMNVRT